MFRNTRNMERNVWKIKNSIRCRRRRRKFKNKQNWIVSNLIIRTKGRTKVGSVIKNTSLSYRSELKHKNHWVCIFRSGKCCVRKIFLVGKFLPLYSISQVTSWVQNFRSIGQLITSWWKKKKKPEMHKKNKRLMRK